MTLVFGYGSNMDDAQMDVRCPKRKKVGIAVLQGYRLCFPRKSDNRGCGVSSVVPDPAHDVWGVIHRLNAADLRALDRSEGYREGRAAALNGYNRIPVVVEMNGEQIEVQTYIATTTENPPAPSAQYLKHIRDGAKLHELPADYQEFLAELNF